MFSSTLCACHDGKVSPDQHARQNTHVSFHPLPLPSLRLRGAPRLQFIFVFDKRPSGAISSPRFRLYVSRRVPPANFFLELIITDPALDISSGNRFRHYYLRAHDTCLSGESEGRGATCLSGEAKAAGANVRESAFMKLWWCVYYSGEVVVCF